MNWINFRHLYSFWMVWKHQGFHKASLEMKVAQPAISEQVSQLENYLGKKLFIRSTRSLALTATGRLVLNYADDIFLKAEEINQVIKDDLNTFSPHTIQFGVVGGVSRTFLSHFVYSANPLFQNSHFNILTGSSEDLYKMLKSHQIHIVFSLEKPDKKDLNKVKYKKVGSSHMCLAGSYKIIDSIKKKKFCLSTPIYEFLHPFPADPFEEIITPKYGIKNVKKIKTDDISLLRFFAEKGLSLMPEIGVLDDIQKKTLQTIPLLELEKINIYGHYYNSGPYKKIAERLLEII
ncbi:MAG: LysR family transcriptional regulator [Oligoflexales bacterium]